MIVYVLRDRTMLTIRSPIYVVFGTDHPIPFNPIPNPLPHPYLNPNNYPRNARIV